jgi:hypothetical protein
MIPPELQEPADYIEEQELFVPADISEGFQESWSPKQDDEQRRRGRQQESFPRSPPSSSKHYASGMGEQATSQHYHRNHTDDHDHNRTHDHQYHFNERSSPNQTFTDGIPLRTASWAAASTPRRTQSFGVLMNGDSSPQS